MKKPTDTQQFKTIALFCQTVEKCVERGATVIEAERRAYVVAGEANPRFAAKGPVWVPKELLPRLTQAFGVANKRLLAGSVVRSSWGSVKLGRQNGTGIWVSKADGMLVHMNCEEFVRHNPYFVIKEILKW